MSTTVKTDKAVDISKILGESWSIFTKNWVKIYGLLLLPFALVFIQEILYSITDMQGITAFIFSIVYTLVQLVVSMGVLKALLYIVRDKEVDIDTILSTKHLLIPYIIATILVALMVAFGIILFIIPGIYLAIKYMFVPYLIVDKEFKAMEAIKKSAEMTKDIKWSLLAFSVIAVLIGYGGIFIFFIGLLVTLPLMTVAYSVLYERVRLAQKI